MISRDNFLLCRTTTHVHTRIFYICKGMIYAIALKRRHLKGIFRVWLVKFHFDEIILRNTNSGTELQHPVYSYTYAFILLGF